MRIGILTHYEVNNLGAQLQMFALSSFLRSLGHETVILTYTKNFDLIPEEGLKNNVSFRSVPYYLKNYLIDKGAGLFLHNAMKYEKLKEFRTKNFQFEPYDSKDLDAVVIGSDEVFSIDVGINQMMYGIGLNCEKSIAYAPAFGKATIQDLKDNRCYDLIKSGLSDMTALSARDTHTQEMIFEMTGRNAQIVCDPVILMDFDKLPESNTKIKKPYLLVYSYDANMKEPEEYEPIQAFAKRHHLLTVSAGTYHKWCDINVTCDPLEWVQYFRDAEFIITDTFHGFVTSLKTERPFAVYVRNAISPYKMRSLMQQSGTEDREFSSFGFAEIEKIYEKQIDYKKVNENLNVIIQNGRNYLLKNLNTDSSAKNVSEAFKDTYCSGCGACTSICPSSAINLIRNTAGYYEADVDKNLCVHCGLCTNVCERFTEHKGRSLYEAFPYALQSSEAAVISTSSSGGIGFEIACNSIEQGRTVCGCAYDYKKQEAVHVLADSVHEIEKLKGSKYLQSNPQDAFRKLLDTAEADSGKQYTVFGTPCQISGLARVLELKKLRNRFLLVEIFCHGVPSYKLWEYQRREIEKSLNGPIENIEFRNKQFGWHIYCIKADHGERAWNGKRSDTEFWLSYFEDGLLNRSCMNCESRKDKSMADIRIGDYWGSRYADRHDGVSAVLCLTEAGDDCIKQLIKNGSAIQFDAGSVDEILAAQNMKGYTVTKEYKETQKLLAEGKDITDVIDHYHKRMPVKKKVKRSLLKASTIIPDSLWSKMKAVRTKI